MKEVGDFTDVDDRQLLADAVALAERENTLMATKYAHLAEIERRGLAMKLGASSVARWWARSTRVADGNAARQLTHAQWLGAWPVVHQALFDAQIHLAHSVAIHDGLDAVVAADPALSDDGAEAIVGDLLDVARTSTAHIITRRASTLALAAAQDAQQRAEKTRDEARRKPEPEPVPPVPPVPPAENAALNRFSIHSLANGRNEFVGNFDALTTDRMKAALNAHSAPRPGPDGERDPRPASQRAADALAILLDREFSGGHRPTFAGTVDLAALATRAGKSDGSGRVPPAFIAPPTDEWPFQLAWSGPVSHALALLVTCDAALNPIIVDGAGVPLAMGRAVRTVTGEQRTAVTVRDQCCIMCGRPPQWCQVHHLIHWAHQGATDLDNLALLCGECHRQVHQHGWDIVLGEDRHPRIIPPETLDAERQPRETYYRQRRRQAA